MDKRIVELYSDGDLARLEQRTKRWRRILWALALGALAACVAMAAMTVTENAERMELAAIAVSTLAGWVVIYGRIFIVTAGRRELGHAKMLREEERERVEGTVKVTAERFAIRGSITVRRVEVQGPQGTRRLLACESRAQALAASGASALYTAHGYAAAYEVSA